MDSQFACLLNDDDVRYAAKDDKAAAKAIGEGQHLARRRMSHVNHFREEQNCGRVVD